MKTEKDKIETQKQQLDIPVVGQRYICKECGTEHFLTDLIMADNGWDYTYSCKKCGDIMESNGTYYW